MSKRLTLLKANELPCTRDGSDYMYVFSFIDTSLIGQPEENYSTTKLQIRVGISGRMEAAWIARQKNINFLKVCYEFGKRELIQKIKDGSIQGYQELEITSVNYPNECPFQSDRIQFEIGLYVDFEVVNKIMEDALLLQIASSIIDSRDFINAIIKERHNKKLFLFSEERDLLQLLRPANTIEEFSYRISSLKSFATNLDETLLRELTGITDANSRSISLLQKYLQQYGNYDDGIINTFRSINRLRQMYPIHGDNVNGVQEAHKYFGIDYPITNSEEAWKSILVFYRDALQRILEIIRHT
ncbi:MAG: hypothetical protein M1391_16095 [Bacteroidetes bacterium]|nr:hypothetical protein [Bacteroidota bacterium]